MLYLPIVLFAEDMCLNLYLIFEIMLFLIYLDMNKKIAVVALGGNALLRGNEVGTIQQQEKNTYETCFHLIKLIKDGYELVITHGNGPQVGNIMLRNEAGYKEYKIPQMPLGYLCRRFAGRNWLYD